MRSSFSSGLTMCVVFLPTLCICELTRLALSFVAGCYFTGNFSVWSANATPEVQRELDTTYISINMGNRTHGGAEISSCKKVLHWKRRPQWQSQFLSQIKFPITLSKGLFVTSTNNKPSVRMVTIESESKHRRAHPVYLVKSCTSYCVTSVCLSRMPQQSGKYRLGEMWRGKIISRFRWKVKAESSR